jgi:LysR family glycine cleavage system transcriptional activator
VIIRRTSEMQPDLALEEHETRLTPAVKRRRLPPLDALRAFEAAARHLSFTRAAEEIQVTQAAVSHRVRELEARLEARLFHRLTRRVELTESGEVLAQAVRRGLDHIARGIAALDTGPGAAQPLRLTTLPSFAQRWLVPRLPRFRVRHPEIEVRVLADARLADLHAGAADLAVRFGRGIYPGLNAQCLMRDAVLPVCSPGLTRGAAAFTPEQIVRHPLLHDAATADYASGEDWASWLAYVGRPELDCDRGSRFGNATLTLAAAAAGLGIALGRRSLLEADLAAGRLVPARPEAAPTAFSYWLVCLPERHGAPRMAAFAHWLKDEAATFSTARPQICQDDILS